MFLNNRYTSHKKIHVTDWLPTILRAADATSEVWQQFEDIDGIDQYEMLFQNGFEVRQRSKKHVFKMNNNY